MKRLNRKGFTLVELLAVIVILAIVVGITMATILPTLDKARSESFGVAMDTIEKYLQDQVELYSLGPSAQGSSYVKEIGAGAVTCTKTSQCTHEIGGKDILTITEYSSNISTFKWYVENGDVKIACATVNPNGDYQQGTTTETKKCGA